MKGVRFYLEFPSTYAKRKGKHSGTVVALLHCNGYLPGMPLRMDAIGGVFDRPNSPPASCAASIDYLRAKCKRIPEKQARKIHPALFEWLDRKD